MIVRPDLARRRRLVAADGDQRVERRATHVTVVPRDDPRALEPGVVEHVLELLVIDRRAGSLPCEHVGELGAGEVGVQRHQVAAEP